MFDCQVLNCQLSVSAAEYCTASPRLHPVASIIALCNKPLAAPTAAAPTAAATAAAAMRAASRARAQRLPAAPWPRRAQRRRVLPVVAFRVSSAELLSLPLNYYACLGLNRASGREAVRKAYERVLRSPPDVGYSQDTLELRAVLLKAAADTLADLELRKSYDVASAASGGYEVEVSPANLPAALVLLQEAGDSAAVISLGSGWLAENAGDLLAPDVAAAVGLAHCDVAAAALQTDASAVSAPCAHLETALRVLRAHSMAPAMQQQIMQALEVGAARLAAHNAHVLHEVHCCCARQPDNRVGPLLSCMARACLLLRRRTSVPATAWSCWHSRWDPSTRHSARAAWCCCGGWAGSSPPTCRPWVPTGRPSSQPRAAA